MVADVSARNVGASFCQQPSDCTIIRISLYLFVFFAICVLCTLTVKLVSLPSVCTFGTAKLCHTVLYLFFYGFLYNKLVINIPRTFLHSDVFPYIDQRLGQNGLHSKTRLVCALYE